METEYYDKLPIFDYFSKIKDDNGDMPFEKIEEIQKKMTAIRGKYRVKIILKP